MSLGEPAHDGRPARTPRDFVFVLVAVVSFLVIIGRLWNVQIKRAEEFSAKSRENFIQIKRIEHDRGEIVDREGRVLVTNRPSLNVYVTPAFFPRTTQSVEALGIAAGLDRSDARAVALAFLGTASEGGPAILLAGDLDRATAEHLREVQARLDLPHLAVPIIELPEEGEPRYAAYLDPRQLPSEGRIYRRLRDILQLNPKESALFRARVRQARGLERYREILVRQDLSRDISERLLAEIDLGDLPGVSVHAAQTRDYRYSVLAAHLLGYVNELTPQELEGRRDLGYRLGDLIGRRGVEHTFEEELRGVDGAETVVVDSKGRPQASRFADQLVEEAGDRVAPRAGNRVVLALDLDLQQAAEKAFTGASGAVVALDVHTGQVLVMTSTPAFDPNRVSGYFDPVEKKRLDDMRRMRPWRFRAIQDQFAPGSTFKAFTLIAALSRKATKPSEVISCGGAFRLGNTRFRCWKEAGHGGVAAFDAVARSCDVYFYTMGNRLGLDPIASAAFDLGFGRKTGIDLAGESPGIIPTEAWYNQVFPDGYTRGAAVNASIGQGAVAVTPLQLAVAYAAIANGGKVLQPQVALRVEAFDGSAVREYQPRLVREGVIPPEVLEVVREGLRRVVNHPNGTAYSRRLKELEVSGKTGTAQVAKMGARVKSEDLPPELRDHAWFAAYAPAKDPAIAIVVLNEHGGHGGSAAAPVAMAVAKTWYEKRLAQQKLGGAPRVDGPSMLAVLDEGAAPWPRE